MAGACYDVCFEADPAATQQSTHWVYAGEGRGAYQSNTEITYVGEGRGAYNKEVVTNNGGWRLRPMWYLCGCFLCFLPLFFITFWFWPRPVPSRDVPDKPLVDCYTGYYNGMWRETWDVDHAAWCCAEMGRGCPAHDEVPVSAISSSRSSGFGPAAFATGAAVALAASASRRRSTGSVLRRTRNHQVSAVAMHGTPVCAGVVITGGAAGVGFAYADEFLARGHQVVICDVKDCSDAVEPLKKKHGEKASIFSTVCDVSNIESINKLIDFVKDKIGVVHYWINNAGINGGRRRFTEISPETVEAVIRVNLGGILLCTHAAMRVMEQQAGVESHIFNTVGSGVKGGGTPGYVAYGATKRGLPQMTESLVKELEEGVQGYDAVETHGKVNCHCLSPGMVFTDLLLNDSTPELRKFPFGVLAAQPEEVAADLVPKIINVSGNGKSVEFLTVDKILTKFFQRFILGEKSKYIDDDGNVIKMPGADYADNGVRVLYNGMK